MNNNLRISGTLTAPPHAIQIAGKNFELWLGPEEIQNRVLLLAQQIQFQPDDILVPILHGASLLYADLSRWIPFPVRTLFARASSYQGNVTAVQDSVDFSLLDSPVRIQKWLEDVRDRRARLILLETIADRGRTLHRAMDYFSRIMHIPRECLLSAVLFCKPEAHQSVSITWYVEMIPQNWFLLGYGMDYQGAGRNLPGVYRIRESGRK